MPKNGITDSRATGSNRGARFTPEGLQSSGEPRSPSGV